MKLMVGLGNPGEKYAQNRHNIGFMFVDYVIGELDLLDIQLKKEHQFDSTLYRSTAHGLILAKPQTFMNRSGQAVKKIMDFYKIEPNDLYVVHDDLDIPFGKFKVQQEGPKAHNGLLSIDQALGTNQYWHVRLGVDNRDPHNRLPGEAYVLQNFTAQEQDELWASKLFDRVSDIIKFL